YIRPSFHWANGWPFSAAYCSEVTAFSVSPTLSAWAPVRNASNGVGPSGKARVPSNGNDGSSPRPSPTATKHAITLEIRITRRLGCPAGVGHSAIQGGPHLLSVFPKVAGGTLPFPRLPIP